MNMDISVVYEDNDVLVVSKPAGLSVHPNGRTKEETLSERILSMRPEVKSVGEPMRLSTGEEIEKHGIVHRLDRDTSGVIIIAKNQEAFLFLKRQFQGRTIQKEYRAIAYGRIQRKEGVIDAPIGKSRSDFRKWSAEKNARGTLRDAKTEFRVLATTPEHSYLAVYPKTGRTHQIRVHLKSIGHPIVCDKLYAPTRACPPGLSRMALHAFSVSFKTPQGTLLTAEAPLPGDFEKALAELNLL